MASHEKFDDDAIKNSVDVINATSGFTLNLAKIKIKSGEFLKHGNLLFSI